MLILLTAGALGIYAEFLRPGAIFPGVCGSALLLWGLAGIFRAGLFHNWRGAALLFVAAACLLIDVGYRSSRVLKALGIALLPLGADIQEPRLHFITAVLTLVPFGIVTSFLVSTAVRARRNKRFEPRYPVSNDADGRR